MVISMMPSSGMLVLVFAILFHNAALTLAQTSYTSTYTQPEAWQRTWTTLSSSTTSTPTPTTTSEKAAKTHIIQVGLADHKFRPEIVKAEVGDTIQFDFFPQNHSVVRAEYKFPCIPYEMTGSNKEGFFSGFHPVDSVLDNPPNYTLKINDTSPIFFYCSSPGSCITYGMVGVINPNNTANLDIQRKMAQDSSYMLQPGEPFPAESPLPSTMPSSTSVASPEPVHGKLSTGAIAGIAIACIGVVVLGSLLFFFWGRFRGLNDEMKRKDSTIVRNTPPRSPAVFSPHHQRTPTIPRGPRTPMTSHTAPHAIPSAYLNRPRYGPHTGSSTADSLRHVESGHGHVSRAPSHRSVGGTFDVLPTGHYERTNGNTGDDPYKYRNAQHTSELASPTDPKIIPVGPYGRQMQELQRQNRSPNGERDVAVPGYFKTATGRPITYHINEAQGPAEIDGTSVPRRGNFI